MEKKSSPGPKSRLLREKAEWDELASSPSEIIDLFKTNMKGWPDIARSCIEASNLNGHEIWPYYFVLQFK
jgi:hypothetical protein